VKEWPSKKHPPAGKLTVKYAILHKIGSANWVSTNHISTISNALRRFIFAVGTKLKLDYDRFMFEQIIKHASTNVVKFPIAFPSIIYGIILGQQPRILSTNDLPSRRKPPLSVHYKLFEGSHVEDIVMTSVVKKSALKGGLIAELKETCKELDTGIRVATTRKEALEALIASLEQAKSENIGQDKEAEAQTSSERSATKDETSGNSVSDADEDASSSSSD
jgi:seryl-tRNA synthetase